jgi:hypothetical protein
MIVDILIPVLGRPQRIAQFIAGGGFGGRLLFIASEGDWPTIDALEDIDARYLVLTNPGEREYARKVNLAASVSDADWLFLGADDLRFHPNWLAEAIAVHEKTGRPVIGTNDLGNPTVMRGLHATHSLVHRSYLELGTIDEPGKLLHEGYGHQWVDTEFCDTAKKRGAWAFAFESHVEHLHPFWHKGDDDVIYKKGRETNRADMQLYRRRRRLWR